RVNPVFSSRVSSRIRELTYLPPRDVNVVFFRIGKKKLHCNQPPIIRLGRFRVRAGIPPQSARVWMDLQKAAGQKKHSCAKDEVSEAQNPLQVPVGASRLMQSDQKALCL